MINGIFVGSVSSNLIKRLIKLAKPYKERELRTVYPDLEAVLVGLLNERGQSYAAITLGISQATVSQIVKRSKRIKRVNRYELVPEDSNPLLTT